MNGERAAKAIVAAWLQKPKPPGMAAVGSRLLLTVQMTQSIYPTARVAKLFSAAMGMALAASLFLLVSGCRESPGATERETTGDSAETIAVRVVPVQVHDVQRGIDVTGTLFADDEARIAARASGRIVSITKDLGDRVAPDEVLAQVDSTDYELTRRQREAAVQEALSRLGLDQLPESDFDVQALPAVQRSAAQEANAKARFERGRQLYESDPPLISAQEYADLATSLEVASHNVKAEMLNGRFLLSQARSRATELDIAQQQLQDTEIRAPARIDQATYAVAARMISVGEYVTPGQAIFELVDVDPIKFRADAPEGFAGAIVVGQTVHVRVDAFDSAFEGRVTRISPRIDPQSRTFTLEAEIPNGEGRLKPGSFAIGRVDTEIEHGVRFVPRQAVVAFAGVKRVFSVVNGKAIEHRVQTGTIEERATQESTVEIVGGDLSADAVVVVEGAQKLVHGQAVKIEQGDASTTQPHAAANDGGAATDIAARP